MHPPTKIAQVGEPLRRAARRVDDFGVPGPVFDVAMGIDDADPHVVKAGRLILEHGSAPRIGLHRGEPCARRSGPHIQGGAIRSDPAVVAVTGPARRIVSAVPAARAVLGGDEQRVKQENGKYDAGHGLKFAKSAENGPPRFS